MKKKICPTCLKKLKSTKISITFCDAGWYDLFGYKNEEKKFGMNSNNDRLNSIR